MHRSIRLLVWLMAPLGAGLLALSTNPITTEASPLLQGAALYQEACAYCHGSQGQGGVRLGAPQLWGKNNLIQNGAYATPAALATFIQRYMPLDPVNGINPGSLTRVQAQSVARYILSQNHP